MPLSYLGVAPQRFPNLRELRFKWVDQSSLASVLPAALRDEAALPSAARISLHFSCSDYALLAALLQLCPGAEALWGVHVL